MELSKDTKKIYEKTLEDAKRELDRFDSEINSELQKTREKLLSLEVQRQSFIQLYTASADLLGVEVEIPEEVEQNLI